MPKKPRRLGRPPASSSVDTRDRIIEIAVVSYSEVGYAATTNKDIANKAGVTTGALYHYFDSKVEMYRAAYEHVQHEIYERLGDALSNVQGFVPRLEAVLESAHTLNRDEPWLARFIGAARVDMTRDDELRIALGRPAEQGYSFFRLLIDDGIKAGEIEAEHRELMLSFIRIIVVGLTDGESDNTDRHRLAVDSVRAVIEGRLFPHPPEISTRA